MLGVLGLARSRESYEYLGWQSCILTLAISAAVLGGKEKHLPLRTRRESAELAENLFRNILLLVFRKGIDHDCESMARIN